MKNLLEETLQCLKENGKNPSDVLWIATAVPYDEEDGHLDVYMNKRGRLEFKSSYFEWKDFEPLAASYEYEVENCDDGLIPLKVVGNGWWLERNGTSWDFKKCPKKPKKKIYPTSLAWWDWHRR